MEGEVQKDVYEGITKSYKPTMGRGKVTPTNQNKEVTVEGKGYNKTNKGRLPTVENGREEMLRRLKEERETAIEPVEILDTLKKEIIEEEKKRTKNKRPGKRERARLKEQRGKIEPNLGVSGNGKEVLG